MGHQVSIQITIQVVVGKGHHDTRRVHVQTILCRSIREACLTIVDVQQILASINAHMQIQIAIVVDIYHRWPCAPAACTTNPGSGGDVVKPHVTKIPIETVTLVVISHKNVGQPIAIHVTNADTGPEF